MNRHTKSVTFLCLMQHYALFSASFKLGLTEIHVMRKLRAKQLQERMRTCVEVNVNLRFLLNHFHNKLSIVIKEIHFKFQ